MRPAGVEEEVGAGEPGPSLAPLVERRRRRERTHPGERQEKAVVEMCCQVVGQPGCDGADLTVGQVEVSKDSLAGGACGLSTVKEPCVDGGCELGDDRLAQLYARRQG